MNPGNGFQVCPALAPTSSIGWLRVAVHPLACWGLSTARVSAMSVRPCCCRIRHLHFYGEVYNRIPVSLSLAEHASTNAARTSPSLLRIDTFISDLRQLGDFSGPEIMLNGVDKETGRDMFLD